MVGEIITLLLQGNIVGAEQRKHGQEPQLEVVSYLTRNPSAVELSLGMDRIKGHHEHGVKLHSTRTL